ncbi:hypothetical protein PM082_014235 [Marasmius tenuissimus]|nr:hypothetical protein PM082_014235 [Marasmius tenuissimus]
MSRSVPSTPKTSTSSRRDPSTPKTSTTSRDSNPRNSPSYTRTVTKTHTRKVEESPSVKITTRTVTRTTTVVVPKTPSQPPNQPDAPSFSTPESADDSDNPNDDATIQFATDSESEGEPLPPSPSPPARTGSSGYLTPTINSRPPSSSRPGPAASAAIPPGTANVSGDDEIHAYYEKLYPGRVPHPDTYKDSNNWSEYHVVSKGRSVGIFPSWNITTALVTGVRRAGYCRFDLHYQAWLAYRQAWGSKELEILNAYQNTAPLDSQIANSGLDSSFQNLTL